MSRGPRKGNSINYDGRPNFGKGSPFHGSGPPKGSMNGAKHYLSVPGGQLPRELKYIQHKRNAFRRQLRAIVEECRPDVDIAEGTEIDATILTCCGWLEDRMKIQRYIRVKGHTLSPEQLLKCWDQKARCLERIERAIKRMGLRTDPVPAGLQQYLETTGRVVS